MDFTGAAFKTFSHQILIVKIRADCRVSCTNNTTFTQYIKTFVSIHFTALFIE